MKHILYVLVILVSLISVCFAQKRTIMTGGGGGGDGDPPPPGPQLHPRLFFNSVELAQIVTTINDPNLDPNSGISEFYSNIIRQTDWLKNTSPVQYLPDQGTCSHWKFSHYMNIPSLAFRYLMEAQSNPTDAQACLAKAKDLIFRAPDPSITNLETRFVQQGIIYDDWQSPPGLMV